MNPLLRYLGAGARLLRSSLLTPAGKLVAAALLAAAYLVLHLAGFSEHVGLVMGTAHGGAHLGRATIFLTAAYMLLYLGFMVISPILVISALLQAAVNFGWDWGLETRQAGEAEETAPSTLER
ncbi:MAG: hypothetical protein ABFD92_10705 [Planctomycetaceae bacterium]|nr:hypothetical protein [Planctomycetaceae bacterium]